MNCKLCVLEVFVVIVVILIVTVGILVVIIIIITPILVIASFKGNSILFSIANGRGRTCYGHKRG